MLRSSVNLIRSLSSQYVCAYIDICTCTFICVWHHKPTVVNILLVSYAHLRPCDTASAFGALLPDTQLTNTLGLIKSGQWEMFFPGVLARQRLHVVHTSRLA